MTVVCVGLFCNTWIYLIVPLKCSFIQIYVDYSGVAYSRAHAREGSNHVT